MDLTTSRPKLAGSYWEWEAESEQVLPPSTDGIVAVVGPSDWGPFLTPVLCTSWPDFLSKFGKDVTDLYIAVYNAFKGQNLGAGGAGAVLVWRMGVPSGGGAAAAATRTLQNTTPANAITLAARYPGTRANRLSVTVQAGAAAGTKDLVVLDGGKVIRTYNFPQADLASLVDEINATDPFLEATLLVDGVALANVASQALAGGVDGDVLTGAEWTAALDGIDSQRFAYLAPFNLTDPTIRASVIAYVLDRNDRGYRTTVGFGGAAAETVATGNTRSQAINSWEVLNIAGPGLHDDDLDLDLSGSQLVARYLGARAARGERSDDIYVRFAGLSPIAGQSLASLTEQEDALDAGSIVFSLDTDETAPIFVREGVTTYSDDSSSPTDENGNPIRPVRLWKRIKNIAVQHGVEQEALEWATGPQGPLGSGRVVNDRTRGIIVGYYKTIYQRRVDAEIIQTGFTVVVASDPAPSDDDDAVFIDHGFHPTRGLRQINNRARLG
jgi:hypothetical protein